MLKELKGLTNALQLVASCTGVNFIMLKQEKVLDFNGSPGASYTIAASQGTIVPLYRFYSSLLDCHFYTISESEKDQVANGDQGSHWGIEHTEGWVLSVQEPGSLPVYRFWRNYNVKTNDVGCHFFTNSETERSALLAEKLPNSSSIPAQYCGGDMWRPEGPGGVGFYAYPSWRSGTVWMKRARKESNNAHFFSIGTAEYQNAITPTNQGGYGYTEEGNAFRAFPALPVVPAPVPQAPAIVKKAKNVQLEIGASSVADRIFDERDDFFLGETIYAHVIGDVNVDHNWKLRVFKNGSIVKQTNSALIQDDTRSDHNISYEPTSVGTYTIEAMVNMGSGFVSKGLQLVDVGIAPVPPAQCSIVPNHSFENGITNWSNQSYGNAVRSITASSQAYDGSGSAYIDITSYTDGQTKFVSDAIDIIGGNTYNLSLFAKGTVTSAYAQPVAYDASGSPISYGGTLGTAVGTDWQEFAGTVTLPADAVTLKLEVRVESSGELFFDDVWVNAIPRDISCSVGGTTGGGVSTASNLITNPSFESDLASWGDQSYGNNQKMIQVSSDANTGTKSAKVDVTSYTDGQVKIVSDAITVSENETYNIAAFVKGSTTSVYLQPVVLDASGAAIGYPGYTGLPITGNYTDQATSITTPPGATSIKLEFRVQSAGDLYVDDVWISTDPRP